MILHRALAAVAGPDRIHGSVAGRDTRLLLDAGLVDGNDVAARLSRRLSIAAPARESRRLAGWPALRRRDAAVVDLTDELDDPVDVLFGVQLGGGTDINRALAYCQDQIARPAETILVLISDLYEAALPRRYCGARPRSWGRDDHDRASGLKRQQPSVIRLRPCAALAGIGVLAFACTPDLFPDLMAAAIERRDVGEWAASQDIPTSH